MRFRKKPVEVEAMQWDGTLESIRVICDWTNRDRSEDPNVDYLTNADAGFTAPFNVLVHTLEGAMQVKPGDWVVQGIKGEFYPCKPDIFALTYEALDA